MRTFFTIKAIILLVLTGATGVLTLDSMVFGSASQALMYLTGCGLTATGAFISGCIAKG